jgi:hypothetical protein
MGIWSRLFGTKKAPRKNSPKFNKVKFQQLLNKNEILNPTGPSYTIANNKKLEPTKRRKITNMLKAFGRGLIPASNPNQRTAKQKRLAKEESEKRGRITKTFNARRASHKKNLNNAFEKLQTAKNKIGNVGLNVSANNVEAFEKAYKKYGLLKQNYKNSYNEKYNAKNFNDKFMKDFFNASEGRRMARTKNSRVKAELRAWARNAGQKRPPRVNLTPAEERAAFGWDKNAAETSNSESDENSNSESDENSESESDENSNSESDENSESESEEEETMQPEATVTKAAARRAATDARAKVMLEKYSGKPIKEFLGQLAVANAATEQIARNAYDQETIDRTLSDFNKYKTDYMAAKTPREKAQYLQLLKMCYKRLLKYEAKSALNNPFSNNPVSRMLTMIPQELIDKLDPNPFTQQLATTS